MSKRARTAISGEDARRAGLHAWETPEGRRWLLKALNPNDTTVPTNGIPTLQSRNISVLNWQGEYSIDAPENLSSTIPSYDSTLFLYQHPLIFGLSATRPSGCIDASEFDGYFKVEKDAVSGKIKLSTGSDPIKPISMTRCARYLNQQVDPSVFKGDSSLAGRRVLFQQLTQRNRIIYGGATIIPTCSNQYNSGTLAVSQSVWSPRKSVLGNNNNVDLWTFTDADFPDTTDTVQNPQMYYGRYQDGAYIPYKLNEPAATPYVGSEQQITTRSPYYITDIRFIGGDDSSGSTALKEVEADYSPVTDRSFNAVSVEAMEVCCAIRIYFYTFTGQRGYFNISLGDSAFYGAGTTKSEMVFSSESETAGVYLLNQAPSYYATEDTTITTTTAVAGDLVGNYIKLPSEITVWQWNAMDNLANKPGFWFVSLDISKSVTATPDLLNCSLCPYNGQSIVTVHTAGVSNTAPIKMILRFGSEILLVASSPYSPFKFMSPRYDESAIKSYARCIRSMKDAYFANAGSIPGQLDYTNKLMTLIENDSAEDLNRTLNQGGTWLGVVQ